MVDKVKLTSIQPTQGSNIVFLDLNFVKEQEDQIEELKLDIIPDQNEEEEIQLLSRGIEEVVENSLVEGTGNIYIKERKYVLPIENLDDATYNVEET